MKDLPKESSLAELLEDAQCRRPLTYDSKGKSYYLGPTSGQIATIWFDQNAGALDKMIVMFQGGHDDKEVYDLSRKKFKGLKMFYVSWARKFMDTHF